jgi:hypothetical protein
VDEAALTIRDGEAELAGGDVLVLDGGAKHADERDDLVVSAVIIHCGGRR